jgi:hypothetical protein
MSQPSDFRSMARSIIQEQPLGGGVQPVATFFSDVRRLVNGTFETFHEEVENESRAHQRDRAWRLRAMQRGLEYMSQASNTTAIFQRVIDTDGSHQGFRQNYLHAMDKFASQMVSRPEHVMELSYKSIRSFVGKLYKYFATTEEMKERYYHMSGRERDEVVSRVLKEVMRDCVEWPAGMYPSTNPGRLCLPITADDSISRIQPRDTSSVVGQAVANKVMSVIKPSRYSSFRAPSGVVEPATPKPRARAESRVEPSARAESRVEPSARAASRVEPSARAASRVEPSARAASRVEPSAEMPPPIDKVSREYSKLGSRVASIIPEPEGRMIRVPRIIEPSNSTIRELYEE